MLAQAGAGSTCGCSCRGSTTSKNGQFMIAEFTPASERVLTEAACWSGRDDSSVVHPPQLLLALSLECECRAARLLADRGVDDTAIRARWPELARGDALVRQPSELSPDAAAAVRAVQSRFHEYPQPLALATEHLLLGLLITPGPVADWLRERGIDAVAVEAEIHRLHGFTPGPLEFEDLKTEDMKFEESVAPSPGMAIAALVPAHDPHFISPTASPPVSILRILDASANRAREGLRVIEDYVRFTLDDGHLTEQLKSLRHGLKTVLDGLPAADLLASRDTQADVGAGISLTSEQTRTGLDDVLAANFKRLEESLRSLEEYSKTIEPRLGCELEQLRYHVYTLERAIGLTRDSLERLLATRLYVLIDGRESLAALERLARTLIAAGVDVIQLRDKRLADRDLIARARLIRDITRDTRTLFIVNDRPDLAALCQADGVHVGQEELSVKDARTLVGPRALVGVSTHSLAKARQAVLDGANYIGVGPTFPSGTKQFEQFTGVELLRAVSQEIRLPAFAIGGINLDNLAQVQAAGFLRVAVSGAIATAADPAQAAREFRRRLEE